LRTFWIYWDYDINEAYAYLVGWAANSIYK